MLKLPLLIASGLALFLMGCERVMIEDQHTIASAGPGEGSWHGKIEGFGGKTGLLTLSNASAGSDQASVVSLQTGNDLAEARIEYINSPRRHYALVAWDGKDYSNGSFVATWRKAGDALILSVPKPRSRILATTTPRSIKQSALIAELDRIKQADFVDLAVLQPAQ